MTKERWEGGESWIAAADLSGKQYFLVKQSALDKVNLATAQGTETGVLQNKPKANEAAAVMRTGTTRVISDGSGTAISVGDKLSSDANGRAVKVTTGQYVGEAMEASSASGTVISMSLMFGGF